MLSLDGASIPRLSTVLKGISLHAVRMGRRQATLTFSSQDKMMRTLLVAVHRNDFLFYRDGLMLI